MEGFYRLIAKFLVKFFNEGNYIWAAVILVVLIIVYYANKKDDSKNHQSSPSTDPSPKSSDEETRFDETEVKVQQVDSASSSPFADTIPIGCTINGKYKVKRYLSSGGFGNTYLVTDDQGQKAAVKELFVREICDRKNGTKGVIIPTAQNRQTFETLKEKFKKEAIRLQNMDNPHIVKVYDVFEDNGTVYYVMDYIDGQSLSDVVKQKGTLSEEELRRLLPSIFDALRYIHSRHIWHLDIKPANIMLSSPSNAVIIDFGASKQYEDSYGNTLSTSSQMYYTQGYAPIEQMARPAKNIGPWTDIYALGATLYFVLTAQKPPNADEILTDGLPSLPAELSSSMRKAITAMMQASRNLRPQNIDEVEEIINESYQ